jgi:hypothetical protein
MRRQWHFLTETELTKAYGERCPTFEPGCCVCSAWSRNDMLLQWEYEAMNDRIDFEMDNKECK